MHCVCPSGGHGVDGKRSSYADDVDDGGFLHLQRRCQRQIPKFVAADVLRVVCSPAERRGKVGRRMHYEFK